MFAAGVALWKVIPAPVKYAAGGLLIIVGFFWWLRIHDNKVAEDAKWKTELQMLEKVEVEKKAAIEAATAQNAVERAKLATMIQMKEAEIIKLEERDISARRVYAEQLRIAASDREKRDAQIKLIPPSELDAAIRARIRELTAGNTTDGTINR